MTWTVKGILIQFVRLNTNADGVGGGKGGGIPPSDRAKIDSPSGEIPM